MQKSRLEVKVGLFVLLGLALMAIAIIQFSKGTSFFRQTYQLRLNVANIGGLKPRAGVLLAGVEVGNVAGIKLAGDGKSVTIFLRIYKEFPIYSDARFVIEQNGFLGDPYVSVIPTLNQVPALTNNAPVQGQAPFNLQEVARSTAGFVKRIDETAQKLDDSVAQLQREVLNETTMTNFAVAINNTRVFSEQALGTVNDINALIDTNSAQVNLAVSNALVFSEDLTRLAASANVLLATNGAEITAAAENVRYSSEVLRKMMERLQSGQGLAGSLLQNGSLATNVQSIAANLAITTSNLNRLGLWGILWAHEPKAAKNENPDQAVFPTPHNATR